MPGYPVPDERPHDGIRFVYSGGHPTLVQPRRASQRRPSPGTIYDSGSAPSTSQSAQDTTVHSVPVGSSYPEYTAGPSLPSGNSGGIPNTQSQQYIDEINPNDVSLANFDSTLTWPYTDPWTGVANTALGNSDFVDTSYLNALDSMSNQDTLPAYQAPDLASMCAFLRRYGSAPAAAAHVLAGSDGLPYGNATSVPSPLFQQAPALDMAPSSPSSLTRSSSLPGIVTTTNTTALTPRGLASMVRTTSRDTSSSASRASTASPSGRRSGSLPTSATRGASFPGHSGASLPDHYDDCLPGNVSDSLPGSMSDSLPGRIDSLPGRSDPLPLARPQVTTGAIARASSKRRAREVVRHADIRCPHCGSTFTKRHNLRNHIRSHLDLREYVCQRCRAAFNNPGGLYRHRRSKGACVLPHDEDDDDAEGAKSGGQ